MEVGCVSDVSEEYASHIFRIKVNTAEMVAGLGGPQIQERGSGKLSGSIAPFHRQVTANEYVKGSKRSESEGKAAGAVF